MPAVLIPWAQNRPWDHQTRQFESRVEGEAIILFKNGALIKSYTVGDLIKDESKAQFSVSHVRWEDREKRAFDPQSNVLTVTARDGLVYNIDIATGEMLDDAAQEALAKACTSNAPYYAVAIWGVAFSALAVFIVMLIRRKRRR